MHWKRGKRGKGNGKERELTNDVLFNVDFVHSLHLVCLFVSCGRWVWSVNVMQFVCLFDEIAMNVCFWSGEGVREGGEELIVSFRDAKSWPSSRARTDDDGRRWKIQSRRRRGPLGIASCCETRVSLPVRISGKYNLTSSTRGLGANLTLTPTYTHVVPNLRHHGNIGTTSNWSSSSDTYSIPGHPPSCVAQ